MDSNVYFCLKILYTMNKKIIIKDCNNKMSPDLFLSVWFSFYKDMKTSGYVFYLQTWRYLAVLLKIELNVCF